MEDLWPRIAGALALQQAGRSAEAERACSEILAKNARCGEAYYILGLVRQAQKRTADAENFYRRAVEVQPTLAEAWCNLGLVQRGQGRLEEGLVCLQRAVAERPNVPEFHNNLGLAFHDLGRHREAVMALRKAVELKPDLAAALNNLGAALHKLGEATEALACYRRAARLSPDTAAIFNNMGSVLIKAGRIDEALACYDRALTLMPTDAEAHYNLGVAYKDAGYLDEAMASLGRAMALKPGFVVADSSRLYTLHFHPASTPETLLQEHRAWNLRHARALAPRIQPHQNDRSPDRRLRIGYVSPDFREHVVGRFMQPLLAHHDPAQAEIFCYADLARPDDLTASLKRHAHHWREIHGVSDDQLAQMIRADRIDVLVDLTLHMGGSRLLAFAQKPAPVQVTYLAYCSTSGLETMDYRLTDRHLDPPAAPADHGSIAANSLAIAEARSLGGDADRNFYTERSVRLPSCYWCYAAPEQAPEVGPLPASAAGVVTFGCLNNFAKVSPATLEMWAALLKATPNSRLVVHSGEGNHRNRFVQRMAALGIDAARIEHAGFMLIPRYFQEYQRIDIALDPYPYGGGTTTCDALWMGVPVVSLAGRTAVSRAGLSILSTIDHPEWVARTQPEYLKIAADLAGDLNKLAEIRKTLRAKILASPLMDAPRFAREMEAAYRQMWRNYAVAR